LTRKRKRTGQGTTRSPLGSCCLCMGAYPRRPRTARAPSGARMGVDTTHHSKPPHMPCTTAKGTREERRPRFVRARREVSSRSRPRAPCRAALRVPAGTGPVSRSSGAGWEVEPAGRSGDGVRVPLAAAAVRARPIARGAQVSMSRVPAPDISPRASSRTGLGRALCPALPPYRPTAPSRSRTTAHRRAPAPPCASFRHDTHATVQQLA